MTENLRIFSFLDCKFRPIIDLNGFALKMMLRMNSKNQTSYPLDDLVCSLTGKQSFAVLDNEKKVFQRLRTEVS